MVVVTTVPNAQVGAELVQRLVEERAVACGNLVAGVSSIYRWEGRVAQEDELLVLLKTHRTEVSRLFQRVADLHPYEVPELIAVTVDSVSEAYGRWVRQETTEVSA